jgi:hypothetical protein
MGTKLISNIPDVVFMLLVRNDFSNLSWFHHSWFLVLTLSIFMHSRTHDQSRTYWSRLIHDEDKTIFLNAFLD